MLWILRRTLIRDLVACLNLRVGDIQSKQAPDSLLGCFHISTYKLQPCPPIKPQLLYVVATYYLLRLAVG